MNGMNRTNEHPLFRLVRDDGRSLKWLARETGYSHSHVRNVKAGMFNPGPNFRAKCAEVLGRDESELFATTATPASNAADVPAA